jgi:xanthine dehydrogenase accessory factor
MLDILRQLTSALAENQQVAYCRLVETRGSTPQKAGAIMLVYPSGSQAGTLGGGCVEAEVKRRALSVLASGQPEVAAFQLNSDYGWDDGLICGGRMQVLVEPLEASCGSSYFQQLASLAEQRGGTEVIAFDSQKSPYPVPSGYLFNEKDELVSTLRGSADAAEELKTRLKPVSSRPGPYAANGLAYLPLLPRTRLVIVGGGHVGKAVYDLAVDLDFDVWIIDDRADYINEQRFPRAERRLAGSIGQILTDLEVTPNTYCLIVTRGHNHDEKALYHLADRGARYVGLIGSRRKIGMIYQDLLAEGFSPEALERVYAPVGIDIGSQTVPEIAISIAAELVAHRNRQGQIPGRPASVPITSHR